MTFKRIVLCLDGTWNNTYAEDKRYDGSKVIKPSNVLKLARAILPNSSDKIAQIAFYDTGVGAMSVFPGPSNRLLQFSDKILGGGWGAGFESNIDDSITFLAHNYELGDQVYIFGFSRGAATARALTQFIDWMGGVPVKRDVYYLPFLLRSYVESKGKESAKTVVDGINKRHEENNRAPLYPFQKINIEYLGVWDTVMALGSKMFTTSHRRFHVSNIPASCIINVRHALSIDEKRSDFKPEIWTDANVGQSLIQRWFAGVHSNIGGGYAHDGLANISFWWIVLEAKACGLELDSKFIKFYREYAQDQLTESKSLKYKVLDGIRLRNGVRSLIGHPASANLDLHYSVISRIMSDPNEYIPKTNQKKHPRLKQYEPHNVFEFLSTIDNLVKYLTQISLRDRNKKPSKDLPQKVLDYIQKLKDSS